MLEVTDIVLRLGAATVIGSAIGLNRELHHKSAGLRTVGLVSLVSSGVTLGALEIVSTPGNAMPVIQGLLTGIGFLGAGVIVRGAHGQKVHGLTTAAAIWGATAIGALCAMGLWPIIGITAVVVLVLLTFGGKVEKWVHHQLENEEPDKNGEPAKRASDG